MRPWTALLLVATVATGTAAIQLWREMQAGRQQIEELQARVVRLEAASANAAEAVEMPSVRPAVSASVTAPSSAPPGSNPGLRLLGIEEAVAANRARRETPEGRAASLRTRRMLVEQLHLDISEALGLTPEEKDRLLDLLARQEERAPSILELPRQEYNAMMEGEKRTREVELQELLGSKYPAWQDYQETLSVWSDRRNLRAVLDAAGTPLTDAQGKALIAAWSIEQRAHNQSMREAQQAGMSPTGVRALHGGRKERMLEAAAPHLDPSQLESYRGMLERADRQTEALLGRSEAAPAPASAASARDE